MGKVGSGRKLGAKALVNKAHAKMDSHLPELIDALIARALSQPITCPHCRAIIAGLGDRESAIYLCDLLLGRPRPEYDARISTEVSLSPEDYAHLARLQAAMDVVSALPSEQNGAPTFCIEATASEVNDADAPII